MESEKTGGNVRVRVDVANGSNSLRIYGDKISFNDQYVTVFDENGEEFCSISTCYVKGSSDKKLNYLLDELLGKNREKEINEELFLMMVAILEDTRSHIYRKLLRKNVEDIISMKPEVLQDFFVEIEKFYIRFKRNKPKSPSE